TTAGKAVTSKLLIDWGAAQSVLPGETMSGDRYLARPFRDGFLIAVVDGLGHGVEAAEAAEIAIRTLEGHIHEPIVPLMKQCHEGLKRTRGAAISLASFSGDGDSGAYGSMTWLGVGNVEGVLLRADPKAMPPRQEIRLFPGVAGYRLPSIAATVTPLSPGEFVIFFSDGIRRGFFLGAIPPQPPQLVAHRICDTQSKGTDDALVFVARYGGRLL